MALTGLLTDIFASVANIYQGREWLDTEGRESDGRLAYNAGLSLAFASFQSICDNSENVLTMFVLAEQAFLAQEIAFCTEKDKKAAISLSNAVKAFDEGLLALKEVEAGSTYVIAEHTYSYRKSCRYGGMPKDAFHYACIGHRKRLDSILHTPGINLSEKRLLEQRLSNINTAQLIYLQKQKKALGIIE